MVCLWYQERSSLTFSCDLLAECVVIKKSEFQKWAVLIHDDSHNIIFINYMCIAECSVSSCL